MSKTSGANSFVRRDRSRRITYLNTSAFSLYLIPFLFKRWNANRRQGRVDRAQRQVHPPGLIPNSLRTLDNGLTWSTLDKSYRSHEYIPVIQDDLENSPSHLNSHLHPQADRPPSTLTSRTLGVRRSNSLIRSLSPSPALITHSSPLSPLPAQRQPDTFSPHYQLQLGSDSAIVENDLDGDDRDRNEDANLYDHPSHSHDVQLQALPRETPGVEPRLTSAETARLAATFCIVWFAANWTVNASLGLTSVGSSTVLAGMSGKSESHGTIGWYRTVRWLIRDGAVLKVSSRSPLEECSGWKVLRGRKSWPY